MGAGWGWLFLNPGNLQWERKGLEMGKRKDQPLPVPLAIQTCLEGFPEGCLAVKAVAEGENPRAVSVLCFCLCLCCGLASWDEKHKSI